MLQQRTRLRRLALWYGLNLIIFLICYLNYRLQLKHRYLLKTLNIGLCFSRAAAMVINFNLLLVWMPMCKYSLTWIAYLANSSLRYQRDQQQRLRSGLETSQHQLDNQRSNNAWILRMLLQKFKLSIESAISQIQLWLCWLKISSTNSFLLAVDHCKSMHTICATTITIAAVVHTVAHLMNVINFSRNYDPILSDLNMAEYKGQNPIQLLISIPGITGILMLLILILMSLSSLDFIRALSFDLFQIFHRLSIIFVILLVLHPASSKRSSALRVTKPLILTNRMISHVLKEQSNVSRHHPELCYNNSLMVELRSALALSHNATVARAVPFNIGDPNDAPTIGSTRSAVDPEAAQKWQRQRQRIEPIGSATAANKGESYGVNSEQDLKISLQYANEGPQRDNNRSPQITGQDKFLRDKNQSNSTARLVSGDVEHANYDDFKSAGAGPKLHGLAVGVSPETVNSTDSDQQGCLDSLPLFVAQNSICWYALSAGLSCYLLDLILRKKRRSKATIQLLDVRADSEGNLIELIFNNNHKRFAHWLPGQFVYLNCPQVANLEWHPFTISSMDNANRLFTLHIKTGGDWTRKLRTKLGLSSVASSCDNCSDSMSNHSATTFEAIGQCSKNDRNLTISSDSFHCELPILPESVAYSDSGKPLVECTKMIRISYDDDPLPERQVFTEPSRTIGDCKSSPYSISSGLCCTKPSSFNLLDLYIDGPFHSPFERLLEQQVSVGIANGVGWTAFSSAFQCVTNQLTNESNKFSRDWWKRQQQLYLHPNISTATTVERDSKNRLTDTKLHLMVIVTSIEQLRPFYELALDYFDRINECTGSTANPVREITAFITRSNKDDKTVTDFCARENLPLLDEQIIRVNETFMICLGRPDFEKFLGSMGAIYADEEKISVYCCGSSQVKRIVRELCRDLNKTVTKNRSRQISPLYSYHEESF